MERPGPELRQTESLDARWYRDFETISSQNDIIECLDGDLEYRSEERRLFELGEKNNPELDYPNIDLEILEKEERELLRLKEAIINDEQNEVIKQAYRWRINEKIAEIRMLKATANGDMRKFKRYAEFVYGKPSKDIFYLSVKEIKGQIRKTKDSENEAVASASRELIEILPDPEKDIQLPEKPSPELVQIIHEIFEKEWKSLELSEIDTDIVTDEIVAQIFERALEVIGANNWQVVIDKDRTRINVSQEQELIKIPKDREIGFLKLKTLVMHEVKRHVERRVKGEASKLSLLGLGLDRYIRGEEGVAKVTEHGIEGKFKSFATPEMYIAIGLALGLDGIERDFRDVYEILEKHFLLKEMRKKLPISIEGARKVARDKAWNHCIRAFRGTDCRTKGVAYTKDIVYRDGTIGVWRLLSQDASEAYKFSIGKYDPTNERHLWVLSQLDITDDALEKIEQPTS
jgi:hypothetical protein